MEIPGLSRKSEAKVDHQFSREDRFPHNAVHVVSGNIFVIRMYPSANAIEQHLLTINELMIITLKLVMKIKVNNN